MKKADGTGKRILCAALLVTSAFLMLLTVLKSISTSAFQAYVASKHQVSIETLAPTASNWLLNAGDEAALDKLPGIGPALAARIIENREAHGPFFFPEDIMEVKGIGEKTYQGILTWLEAHPEAAYIMPQE